MDVCCSFDSITGKIGLFSKQNVVNHLGVNIDPILEFQVARHVCRFKVLNALGMCECCPLCNILQILMCGVMRQLEIFVY
jgi:hypothetical protein